MSDLFNSQWWSPEHVERLRVIDKEMGGRSPEWEISKELGLMRDDAVILEQRILEHLKGKETFTSALQASNEASWLQRWTMGNSHAEHSKNFDPAKPLQYGPDWQTRPLNDFTRRVDVMLLVDIFKQIRVETGCTLREAVEMVQACLQPLSYDIQFWRLPLYEGIPHKCEIAKGGVMIELMKPCWWNPAEVKRKQMGGSPPKGEDTEEVGLLREEAEKVIDHIVEHLRGPICQTEHSSQGYLDPNHPRYAPKLAAAVRAWQAMDDESLRRGKTPSAAMKTWLESRYQEFGLVHKQAGKNKGEVTHKVGDKNGGAITQICEVANWSKGGPAKTPGS